MPEAQVESPAESEEVESSIASGEMDIKVTLEALLQLVHNGY